MKRILKVLPLTLIISSLLSCNEQSNPVPEKTDSSSELIQADRDFSKMSEERGMKNAFTHFMAKEGVLLRPEEHPIIGADAIEYISEINDSNYVVSWHPLKADICSDGSLGYTYGIYEVAIQDTTIKGTYVNIWKKQNGQWRFVLNTGNQGIPSE